MFGNNGSTPGRAVLYARVSTDEQAKSGFSLAQQLEALREYCAREGYEVLEEVRDEGWSGAYIERPGLDRVRDLVEAGGVSVVLAQDADRITRDPGHRAFLDDEFERQGTQLAALDDWGDGSHEGELLKYLRGWVSKGERLKTAERSRRGRLRKAREGKVLATHASRYGFKLNAARDGYEVYEPEMEVVRRIFRLLGFEGTTLRAAAQLLDSDGVPTPKGAVYWDRSFLRTCVLDDVYRPHSVEEVEALVSPEVAARLDPEVRYGVWWFNRRGLKIGHVSGRSGSGGRTRKTYRWHHKPKEEHIAVPVPDSGVPRDLVDAAREAIKDNRAPSKAGQRYWELSGVVRCAGCGKPMASSRNTKKRRGSTFVYFYYRCSVYNRFGRHACEGARSVRAEPLEDRVWDEVSGLLKNPARLRAGLEKLIEEKRAALSAEGAEREAGASLGKIAAAKRKRAAFQDMAAEGLITFTELAGKLEELDEIRDAAERELDALRGRESEVEVLERDAEALLASYEEMAPAGLDAFGPEDRRWAYKLLKTKATVGPDGEVRDMDMVIPRGPAIPPGSSETGGSPKSARMAVR